MTVWSGSASCSECQGMTLLITDGEIAYADTVGGVGAELAQAVYGYATTSEIEVVCHCGTSVLFDTGKMSSRRGQMTGYAAHEATRIEVRVEPTPRSTTMSAVAEHILEVAVEKVVNNSRIAMIESHRPYEGLHPLSKVHAENLTILESAVESAQLVIDATPPPAPKVPEARRPYDPGSIVP